MTENKKKLEEIKKSLDITDPTLIQYIQNDCDRLDREKVRVRFYKTAKVYSVFDMLVDKDVYEDYADPGNNNSIYVDKLEGKIFDKHQKLNQEFEASMTSEIIE